MYASSLELGLMTTMPSNSLRPLSADEFHNGGGDESDGVNLWSTCSSCGAHIGWMLYGDDYWR